jgi:hypothetical protein
MSASYTPLAMSAHFRQPEPSSGDAFQLMYRVWPCWADQVSSAVGHTSFHR